MILSDVCFNKATLASIPSPPSLELVASWPHTHLLGQAALSSAGRASPHLTVPIFRSTSSTALAPTDGPNLGNHRKVHPKLRERGAFQAVRWGGHAPRPSRLQLPPPFRCSPALSLSDGHPYHSSSIYQTLGLHLSHLLLCEIGTVVIPISQWRKLRHREVRQLGPQLEHC